MQASRWPQIPTNTKIYIAMTFPKRLSKYVKHRYKLDGAQTRAVMTDIYALHYTEDNAIVKDLRQKIPQRAAVGNLENRPHVYLPLLYEILQYCEKNNPTEEGDQRYDKKAKHVRLLPTKSGFESSNIKICGTGLYSLLKRQGNLEGWTEDQYEDTKDQWWRCLFQIENFETVNRTFAGEILTDGVSLSIMMCRKKPRDQCDKEADLATARRESRANPIKRKPGPKVGKALKKQHNQPYIDLNSFDRVLGLDPGCKSLFVTCDMENNHLHFSTKQFYHGAKYIEGNRPEGGSTMTPSCEMR